MANAEITNKGLAYVTGPETTHDFARAYYWFRWAAEQGYPPAQMNLAILYEEGLGTARNYSEALRWYKKAGESGFGGGYFHIGTLYENGRGVSQNATIARWWHWRAGQEKILFSGLTASGFYLSTVYDEEMSAHDGTRSTALGLKPN